MTRLRAIGQGLLVTFLWATSSLLIKWGLDDLPALPFAGLRCAMAFFCLLPLVLKPEQRAALRRLSRRDWLRLAALGVCIYTVTQGAAFLGLYYLPAATVSLLFSTTTIAVALAGIWLLNERPTGLQWFGIAVFFTGLAFYFYPLALPTDEVLGVTVVGGAVIFSAAGSLLGRAINRERTLDPLLVTIVSLGVGGFLLLVIGITLQGLPALTLRHILIIIWLAAVNMALAFTLWNQTLRVLTAVESNIINNMMQFQVVILAWLFLSEALDARQIVGMIIAVVGGFLVQLRQIRRQTSKQPVRS